MEMIMAQLPVNEMDTTVHTSVERVEREAAPYKDMNQAEVADLATTYGFSVDQLRDRSDPSVRVIINLILVASTLSHRVERLETLIAKEFDLEKAL